MKRIPNPEDQPITDFVYVRARFSLTCFSEFFLSPSFVAETLRSDAICGWFNEKL
jgi:hypothetical protein